MKSSVILLGISASIVLGGADPSKEEAILVAERAGEVTRAAASAEKKNMFATVGVYAALLTDKDIKDDVRKRLQDELDREKTVAPKTKSKDRKTSPDALRAQIQAAIDEHDPLAVLDGVGRLVMVHSDRELDSLDATTLIRTVRIVAGLCPKCYGSQKEACANCQGGVTTVQKPCDQCIAGMVNCPKCNGGLWHTCENCKGRTKVEITEYINRGALNVPQKRLIDCDTCRRWWNVRRGFVECDNCLVGKVECMKCKKLGTIQEKGICSECEKGKVPCSECGGTGKRNP